MAQPPVLLLREKPGSRRSWRLPTTNVSPEMFIPTCESADRRYGEVCHLGYRGARPSPRNLTVWIVVPRRLGLSAMPAPAQTNGERGPARGNGARNRGTGTRACEPGRTTRCCFLREGGGGTKPDEGFLPACAERPTETGAESLKLRRPTADERYGGVPGDPRGGMGHEPMGAEGVQFSSADCRRSSPHLF